MSEELREMEEVVLAQSTKLLGLVDRDYRNASFRLEFDLLDGFGKRVHGALSGNRNCLVEDSKRSDANNAAMLYYGLQDTNGCG